MRADIFKDRKCIHIQLDKGVHAALRAKMFYHDLSMQEVFDAFAKLIVTEDNKAAKIIENIVKQKLQDAIAGKPVRREKIGSELDHDALYSLIEERQESDETD